MAVLIDIGDAADIHPKNKWDVGKRLSLPARAKLYGEKALVWSGPLYQSMQVKGKTIRMVFGYADGLTAKGSLPGAGKLNGFAISGADGKWFWADAVVNKDTVIVSSASVATPTMVHYGWANNPDCNLVNAAGLPASPFRTEGAQLPVPVSLARPERAYGLKSGNLRMTPADAAATDALGRGLGTENPWLRFFGRVRPNRP